MELLRRDVLPRCRPGQSRDVFIHQRAAIVVGARHQTELGQLLTELHPGDLDIIDPALQHQTAEGMHA